ncbi:MAG: hypothetical protein H7096_10490 [Flavobacterium sp.]|nr:hypothetical protein [Pedobacter sp.]
MEEDAKKIAFMQCQSRQYTKEKFFLADQYNSLDNQLINKEVDKKSADSTRLRYDSKKKKLLQEAQLKSDSLLNFLRKVWNDDYTTKADKKALDSLTKIELTKICDENPI